MQIGAMNHPAANLADEIRWMSELGLDFLDLTLEPPAAHADHFNAATVRQSLDEANMGVVGHTAFYLPIANPFESIRCAALSEIRRCIEVFAAIGVKWVNLHPDRHTPMHPRSYFVQRNIQSLEELLPFAASCGVGLMIENVPGDFNTPEQLAELFDPLPEIGLHLDIGHANLLVPHDMTRPILNRYGSRLKHVHLHDNKGGGADLHLPLGCGNVDVQSAMAALKKLQYDGTITLEVFSPDRGLLRYSRDLLRRMWDQSSA